MSTSPSDRYLDSTPDSAIDETKNQQEVVHCAVFLYIVNVDLWGFETGQKSRTTDAKRSARRSSVGEATEKRVRKNKEGKKSTKMEGRKNTFIGFESRLGDYNGNIPLRGFSMDCALNDRFECFWGRWDVFIPSNIDENLLCSGNCDGGSGRFEECRILVNCCWKRINGGLYCG